MPLVADYAELHELRHYLRVTDDADNLELALALDAASRAIDHAANRHFGRDDAVTNRLYTPRGSCGDLEVDDISTTTGLVVVADYNNDGVFEETLTLGTDFRLLPANADLEGRPWERLGLYPVRRWPTWASSIKVTARFGWPNVPAAIKNAVLAQAGAVHKGGRDAPLGVAGSPELGNELRLSTKLHPMVAGAVRNFTRVWGVV